MDLIVYNYQDIATGVVLDRTLIYYWDDDLRNQHHSVEEVADRLNKLFSPIRRVEILDPPEDWDHEYLAQCAIAVIIERNRLGIHT